MRAAKICFVGLMIILPALTDTAFAERPDEVPQPKVVVGDETSDAMITSSVTPTKEMSCSADKLGIKSATHAFNMSYAFDKKIGGFEEPSP
jgi:hypothetical protein